jgi:hypothetical protein
MKKIFLMAALALGFAVNSQANTFTFINMTGCTYTYHVAGVDPVTSTMFTSSPVSVPPGTLAFPVPSSLPGVSPLSATVNYYYVRGWVNSSPMTVSANVGNFPTQGFPPNNTVPANNCHPQISNISFNGNSTGSNVVVLIF